MATELKMPKLGMTMTKGRLTKWEKMEGEYVNRGEPLYCITTDKVNIDIESPVDGFIIKIVHNVGDTVAVGEVIALIGQEGETVSKENKKNENIDTTFFTDEVVDSTEAEMNAGKIILNNQKMRSTPAARAVAKQNGIVVDVIPGSGTSGKILRRDVEEYLFSREMKLHQFVDQAWEDIELFPIQQISAQKMTENFRTAPHFYLTVQVDVSTIIGMLEKARSSIKYRFDIKATITDVLVWILSRVIAEHPKVNAASAGEKIRIYKNVNIGIATDTNQGLVVPVIHKSNSMSFSEIVVERERLINLARKGNLLPDDIADGTFTISNLGMFGINVFQAIINSPQSALLAIGGITKVLVMEDGEVIEKSLLNMSLSCDHRVLDGAAGAKFLKRLKEVMEKPAKLLDLDLF